MRKYQLNMTFTYLSDNELKKFTVYTDSNNVWETVCSGFHELIRVLTGCCGFTLPSFGRRESYESVE